MTRTQFIEHWLGQFWKESRKSRASYVNTNCRGHRLNVAVMRDYCNEDEWTYSVRPWGEEAGGFSNNKFRTEDEAKLAALEEAADRFGLR